MEFRLRQRKIISYAPEKKWQSHTVLKLIKLYEERPILWQLNHPYYHQNIKRNVDLQQISDSLKVSKGSVTDKINQLRFQLTRVNRKLETNQISNSNWRFFEAMQFITLRENESLESIVSVNILNKCVMP